MMRNDQVSRYCDLFVDRHIGVQRREIQEILKFLGFESLEELVSQIVPKQIRMRSPLQLGKARSEYEVLNELRAMASKNHIFKSFIGMGYSNCITPPVIQRNILENPGWYTQYTPYQAEISQGRLEALLNFQTMVIELTGLPIANASLLDESTAAAEAMTMAFSLKGKNMNRSFFVSNTCHPQTIDLIKTRSEPLGIQLIIGDHQKLDMNIPIFAALIQYPATHGSIYQYSEFIHKVQSSGALVIMAADLLSLALLSSPGELKVDIAVGSTQRFGVPIGYGGPHAAYFATKDEYKRLIPGRIVGVSRDVHQKPAMRLALQTREQHIRRDKVTSNICTAQALLAIMASMYAIYHGPQGILKIAQRIHLLTTILKKELIQLNYSVSDQIYFDTIQVFVNEKQKNTILNETKKREINLRYLGENSICISLDELTSVKDLKDLISVFAVANAKNVDLTLIENRIQEKLSKPEFSSEGELKKDQWYSRKTPFLTQTVFNSYHSETEILRYIFKLQSKDLSLIHSMIPLGSCTMKLNATSEMLPISWKEFSQIHPFVPLDQVPGYTLMLKQLESQLAQLTGFAAVSLQPNAGSQGEYAGLLVIRKYHQTRGEAHRNVCLIPRSAHGTNPASATLAGMRVVVVECDSFGNIDMMDLKSKATQYQDHLSALMVTYPSTHGVFEEKIKEICEIIHQNGGQVYMDGANMNAQIGICRPGEYGPDVCHLNLHKTFCIPHGGGGPGMGPICVAAHLKAFLPSHCIVPQEASEIGIGSISAAPWGSASILPISWMYISMMGAEGLTLATQVAMLNANYIAKKLNPYYPILYIGKNNLIAHECIFDLRHLKDSAGVDVEDVAKRLMDYGFHAPTISFPVMATMMVEPTESESKAEMDRFCEAMIQIREEIREIEEGKMDRQNNLLKNAPHTSEQIAKEEWPFPYSRERAVYPLPWVREHKFWPSVGRINNVLGDRQLICSCLTFEES